MSGNSLSPEDTLLPALDDDAVSTFYSMHEEITPEIIENLVDIFYHVGYPLCVFVSPWIRYRAQISEQRYKSDWGSFIVTMAVCSLAAWRLHDGNNVAPNTHLLRFDAATLASKCYDAALSAIPADFTAVKEWYPLMKAKALLASACLQNGDLTKAVAHGGDYISLSISRGFHNEANWPSGLAEHEKQERRRLFWGVYQHDQHLANSFGLISRQRETKAAVQYPAEIYDDTDITESEILLLRPEKVSFLRGWNFCTDLYRLLEHMDGLVRAERQIPIEEPGGVVTSFLSRHRPHRQFASDCLQLVSKLYEALPEDLRTIKAMTGDPQLDRYGFIAANILITTQTLKMVLVGHEKPSIHLRCAIATELLDELSTIPLAFFHASSSVTLHHLAQVGHMLAAVIQNPISAWTYLQVRNILLVLAEFLTKLESTRVSGPVLAMKLRGQISRIDKCMQQMSQHDTEPGLLSIGQTLLSNWPNGNSFKLSSNPNEHSGPSNSNVINENQLAQISQSQSLRDNHRSSFSQQQHQIQRPEELQNRSSSIRSDILTSAPEPVLSNLFEFPQTPSTQLPLGQSNTPNQYSLPNDLFDNWTFLLGQIGTLEPGLVYDVTDFLQLHPGGKEAILKEAGKDASHLFSMLHPPDALESLPSEACIGPVDRATIPVLDDTSLTEEEIRRQEQGEKMPPVDDLFLLQDFEDWAERVLSQTAWAYYRSAADEERTFHENRHAFQRYFFRPRVLRNTAHGTTETTFMGLQSAIPVFISPTAMAKLGHPIGEVNITKAAGHYGLISSNASCSVEEIFDARVDNQPLVFQLYLNKDRAASEALIRKVEMLGAKAIVFTVDVSWESKRTLDVRAKTGSTNHRTSQISKKSTKKDLGVAQAIGGYQDRNLTWSDISFIRRNTKLPIIVKGVQCIDDVQLCVDHGADGVIISNHGGRQADYAPAPIDVLYEMRILRPDLFEKIEVMIDGGIRCGADVVKALAMGAKAVGVGRPFLYANGTHGEEGVKRVIEILHEEITNTMRNIGVTRVEELKPEMVGPAGPWVGPVFHPHWMHGSQTLDTA
ncbi:hypothetical protein CNBD2850 [Paecilomyces variotii No. 5]|uniref:L-lactate dehydrogenase (cytochrome) n=1 Tax=Byssochlamys spectabilis (strain No. 5 / NBRC 109023) TaxID=1356009 RepID=V5G8H9_BYSSN|nr:hypothetical protein CNBD2850 [Paecilomyces variotii No. 5]